MESRVFRPSTSRNELGTAPGGLEPVFDSSVERRAPKDLRGSRRLVRRQHLSVSGIEDDNVAHAIAHIDLRAILRHLHRRGRRRRQTEFELISDFAGSEVEDLQLPRIPKEPGTVRMDEYLPGEERERRCEV